MIRIFVGFDDTDVKDSIAVQESLPAGSKGELPRGCNVWGVVRQQLLVNELIPYTSHNSSACVVIECPETVSVEMIADKGHLSYKTPLY